jgi:hypothetical protein
MKTNNDNKPARKPLHGKELLDEIAQVHEALQKAGLKRNPKIGIGHELGDTGQMISLHLNTHTPRQNTNDA